MVYNKGDIIRGNIFLSLLPTEIDKNGRKRKKAELKCKCGNTFISRLDGNATSCGCKRLKKLREKLLIKYEVGEKINGILFLGDIIGKKKERLSIFQCPYCINSFISRVSSIKNGHTKSCGCYKIDKIKLSATKHGGAYSQEYKSWQHMKSRCLNPHDENYKDYGGRGILICSEWENSFKDFYKDMGNMPTSKHTIERIDNNGNYFPQNCKWATKKEQNRNRRNTVYLTYMGIKKPFQDWIDATGICRNTVKARIKRGLSIEESFGFKLKNIISWQV